MLKAVIIEDEHKSSELLSKLLEKNCPEVQLLGIADGVQKGVQLVRGVMPELLFLDIAMPDGSGFDLLEQVQGQNFEVIFTTATDKHAVKAIKYSALDYLLKPIDAEELKAAIKKLTEKKSDASRIDSLKFLLENIRKDDDQYQKITIPSGNAYEIIFIKDIVRLEAQGGYTKFVLSNGRNIMVSFSMKHYEDLLPEKDFFRIHHQHLINLNHIVRVLKADSGYAVMSDNSQIEVSRRKRDEFLARINKL